MIRRVSGGDGQGEPRWINAWSRLSGHMEVIHQCRPHCKNERWGPPMVDYDWYAFCQALCKGIE